MTKRSEGKAPAGLTLPAGSHAALLYGEPAAAAEALAYAAAAASRGEAVALLAYARFNERAAAQLRDLHGIDVRAARADRSLVFLDGSESARDLKTELVRFLTAARRDKRPARILTSLGWGEAGWPDDDELLRLELSLTALCREHGASALCLYDARQLPGGTILDGALGCHGTVLCRGEATRNPFARDPALLQRELTARRRGESRLKAWMT